MAEIISSKYIVASADTECDSYPWLCNYHDHHGSADIKIQDIEMFERQLNNKGIIPKGAHFKKVLVLQEGMRLSLNIDPPTDELCLRYGMYE
ncbi:hypothetical protein AB4254_11810 [Vibrio breoganii]